MLRYIQIELEYFEKNIVGECVDGHLLAEQVCKALAQKLLEHVYGKCHSLLPPSTEKSFWHRAASSVRPGAALASETSSSTPRIHVL